MNESAHQQLAHFLRQLAERIEKERPPVGVTKQLFGYGRGMEALLDGRAAARLERAARVDPHAAPDLSPPAETAPLASVVSRSPAERFRIWCDGSCAPNPGPGGWGAIVERNGSREEFSGASPASTNNIMEMTGAIEALRRIPAGASADLTTDSRYLVDGMTRWLGNWKRKGWRTSTNQAVKNRALWETLDELASERHVRWHWVEGHAGHPENERCDLLANAAREQLRR